jgi:Na+-transporting methylmalonyl-CoA/oxaloacetate decarboxylase gamma subunit
MLLALVLIKVVEKLKGNLRKEEREKPKKEEREKPKKDEREEEKKDVNKSYK